MDVLDNIKVNKPPVCHKCGINLEMFDKGKPITTCNTCDALNAARNVTKHVKRFNNVIRSKFKNANVVKDILGNIEDVFLEQIRLDLIKHEQAEKDEFWSVFYKERSRLYEETLSEKVKIKNDRFKK